MRGLVKALTGFPPSQSWAAVFIGWGSGWG